MITWKAIKSSLAASAPASAGAVLILLLAWLVFILPESRVAHEGPLLYEGSAEQYLRRLQAERQFSLAVAGGIIALLAFRLHFRRVRAQEVQAAVQEANLRHSRERHDDTLKNERTRQLNERFARAGGGLGDEVVSNRLTALYALHHITEEHDSERFLPSIVELMTAFIREVSGSVHRARKELEFKSREFKHAADMWRWEQQNSGTTSELPEALRELEEKVNELDAVVRLKEAPREDTRTALRLLGTARYANIPKDLSACFLKGYDLRGLNLKHTDFSKAILDDADFRGANLSHCKFNKARFVKTDLTGAKIRNAVFFRGNFNLALLSEVDFSGSKFSEVKIEHMDCTGANFSSCTFHRMDLKGVRFPRTPFPDTRMTKSSFSGCDFRGSEWTNAEARGCHFQYANFENALYASANFADCRWLECEQPPGENLSMEAWEQSFLPAEYPGMDREAAS